MENKFKSMNKKGSDIPSFFYVIAIIFTIGILLYLLSFLDLNIYNIFNNAINGIPGQSGAPEANETLTKALILIDKNESLNEKKIQTETDLVKTIMLDTVDNFNDNNNHNNNNDNEASEGNQGPECVQQ